MSWRAAKSLLTLIAEVNKAHPGRPKGADGLIGDSRHQATQSDHNPNAANVVTAWDITTADFTDALAESLRRLGESKDGRVKYVIFKGRIAGPPVKGWKWRPYSGFSKHFDHIHLSVSSDAKQYDRADPWFPIPKKGAAKKATPTPTPPSEDDVTPEDRKAIVDDVVAALKGFVATHEDIRTVLHGTKPDKDGKLNHPANLDNIWNAVSRT